MVWVLLAQYLQGFVDLVQLYGAMSGEVSTLRVALGEVAADEYGLGATKVAGAEVCLC